MMKRIGKLLRTIRYIRPIQIVFQIRNRLINPSSLGSLSREATLETSPLSLIPFPRNITAVRGNEFTFLNLSKVFPMKIDWNFLEFGKLWNYNLQYLDFIHQHDIPLEKRIEWVSDVYGNLLSGEVKLEPYPASLRSMNVVRLFSESPLHIARCPDLQKYIFAELEFLDSNYEYHILGNHLLENAFAMLMGSYYFENDKWRGKAEILLTKQLNEQILVDGAHFELSPMYHKIILFRVLEAISYANKNHAFEKLLKEKAEKMLGWLHTMTFSNGSNPHFNDSTDGVSPSPLQLFETAKLLKLNMIASELVDSGYRKFSHACAELICDVHGISPSYQPGHAHSDHLSFVLHTNGAPFIVDPGTSTYNICERRNWERSTCAHNTVTVNNQNQSEVWGGFRVGRRAKVKILNETESSVKAVARYLGISHERSFQLNSSTITISDVIDSDQLASLRLYLHPSKIISSINGNRVNFDSGEAIQFKNVIKFHTHTYDFAAGFNKLEESTFIEAKFSGNCLTTIFTS